MSKLIREGRMGPPMSYKTGAIVGTYPRPLLHLGGDPHGLDIVPEKPTDVKSPFKMEITQKDITRIPHEQVETFCNKKREELPPVTHVNFCEQSVALSELYQPAPDTKNFPAFNRTGNLLITKCPWRTVVVDPVTSLSGIIYGHLAATQPGQLADPRKWAASIGLKVQQTMASFNRLQAHVIFIMHSTTEKDELTSKIKTEPMIYSQFRQVVAGLFAQFFYAEVKNGVPIVWTQPQGFCVGIGTRWPIGLKAECGAHFEDIYGEAVKRGEVER